MGSQPTDKQIMASLPYVSGGPTVYTVRTWRRGGRGAWRGLLVREPGVEQCRQRPTSTPAPCDTSATIINLHWCQAYTKYVGQVPFARSRSPRRPTRHGTIDIGNLLQYALDNHIQIFELYPEEWLSANSPTWPSFVHANQAKYQAALQAAAQTLGATNGQ